jgi:Protein of unknown function (DUF2510)
MFWNRKPKREPAHKTTGVKATETDHGAAPDQNGTKPEPPSPKAKTPKPTLHTPIGWYPDPSDARQMRWWDGYRWTDDVDSRSGY